MRRLESMMTRHMMTRMNQRGIPGSLVDLVLSYGLWDGDACKLGRNDLRKLMDELEQLRSTVLKALDKGGLAVVESGGALVTAYARPKAWSGHK